MAIPALPLSFPMSNCTAKSAPFLASIVRSPGRNVPPSANPLSFRPGLKGDVSHSLRIRTGETDTDAL